MPHWENVSADNDSSKMTAALIREKISDKNAEYGSAISMGILCLLLNNHFSCYCILVNICENVRTRTARNWAEQHAQISVLKLVTIYAFLSH